MKVAFLRLLVLGLLTPLLIAAADPHLAKPSFGFACHPKDPAASSPTFEYRIYLPSADIPSESAARVEVTKLQGMPGAPDHIIGEGQFFRMQTMPDLDGKSLFTLFKVEAVSPDTSNGGAYKLSMFFSVKQVPDSKGGLRFGGLGPSNGTLRPVTAATTSVQLICVDISGRAPERG